MTDHLPLMRRVVESAAAQLDVLTTEARDTDIPNQLAEIRDLLLHAATLATDASDETAGNRASIEQLIPRIGDPAAEQQLHRMAHTLLDRSVKVPTADESPVGAADDLSIAEVEAYLHVRFPESLDKVISATTIHGGYSKRTTLVDGTVGGVPQQFVLRQAPAGLSSRSLAPEFALLERLAETRVPAPRPLWIEPDHNILGGPFFATRRAPGANIGNVWGSEGATVETCRDVAEIYADLHQVDTEGLRTPVSPRVTPDEILATIAKQESTLHQRGIRVEPVLAALLQWLRRHVPQAPTRPALLHGDAAFSNLLVTDHRVTAVVDWEAAHLGNPAEELAYLRPSVTPVMEWTEFMDHYVRHGGLTPDPAAMQFFAVWSHVWRHIGCLWLAQNFEETGRYASAVAGFVHGPRFLRAAVDAAFADFATSP